GPAEADDFDLARLSGRGRDPGQADQAFGCGEAAPGVADLSEQSSGADLSAAGQAGEDVCVWVQSELFSDLVFQRCDLGADGLERGDEGEGDLNAGLAVGSGQAAGRAGQPGVQHARVGAPAVADTGQPGGQPFGREPVGAVLAGEA